MHKIFYLFICFVLMLSCKKDKLTGNYSILEGKWRWSFSVKKTYNIVSQVETFDTLYANLYQDTYELEFIHKGKLYVKKNELTEQKWRLVFNYFVQDNICNLINDAWRFGVKLNNKEKYPYNGCVNNDTLIGSNKNLPDNLQGYENYPYDISFEHYYTRY